MAVSAHSNARSFGVSKLPAWLLNALLLCSTLLGAIWSQQAHAIACDITPTGVTTQTGPVNTTLTYSFSAACSGSAESGTITAGSDSTGGASAPTTWSIPSSSSTFNVVVTLGPNGGGIATFTVNDDCSNCGGSTSQLITANTTSGSCNLTTIAPTAQTGAPNASQVYTYSASDASSCDAAGGMSGTVSITSDTTGGASILAADQTFSHVITTSSATPIHVTLGPSQGSATVHIQCTSNCATSNSADYTASAQNTVTFTAATATSLNANSINAVSIGTNVLVNGSPGTYSTQFDETSPSSSTLGTVAANGSGDALQSFSSVTSGSYVIEGTLQCPVPVGTDPGCDAAASAPITFNVNVEGTGMSIVTPVSGSVSTTPSVSTTLTARLASVDVPAADGTSINWSIGQPAGGDGVLSGTTTTVGGNSDSTFTATVPGTYTVTALTGCTWCSPGFVSFTVTVTAPTADLSVTKTDSPDPITAGNPLTYTITVANAGPDPASTAALSDTLPAGVTFASLTSAAGWTCGTPAVGGTGTVSCTNPSVASGASDVFTLVVDVSAGTTGTVNNTATVSTATADSNAANDSATSATTVNAPPLSADLSVTKTDSPDPITAGNPLTYTITVANAGPDPASTAALSDTLPAGVTFASLTAAAGWTCGTPAVGGTGTVSCTNPSVASGASDVFTLVVDVSAGTTGTVNNTATVSTATADSNAANDSATSATTVNAPPLSADLSVTKTDSPDPITAGNPLTYTITVANAGPDPASTAALSDTLPAGVTFASLTAAAGWTCGTPAVGGTGTVSCTNPSVASGASDVFTLVVDVSAGTTGTVNNTATVSTATADPNAANDSATSATTVNAPPLSADLSVTKTDSPDPITAGNPLTYTITVANAGPDPASTAALSDTLPAGVTFASLTAAAGWTCGTPAVGGTGTVSCTNPSVASGASDVFTLVVDVGAATSGSLSNTATVSTTTADPNAANDSATSATTVNAPPLSADLSVTKTDSPDPITAGNPLTYTITVANAGPDPASTAALSDTLPAGVTFASLTAAAGWTCGTPAVGGTGTVSCTNPSVASGASDVFTLVVDVSAGTTGTVNNTATVSTATADPNAVNDSATSATTVNAPPLSADLSVTKTDSPDPITAGNPLTYTITVANAGPDPASTAALSDTLPAGVTFASLTSAAGWTCGTPAVGGTGTVSCTNPSVASGASDVFTLVVDVSAGTTGTVNNTATVSTATADSNAANDSATSATTVNAPPLSADLSVTKTDSPDPITAGNPLTYTITVANAGPDPASTAALSDTLPAGVTFASLTAAAGWTCGTPAVGGTGTVSCTNPSVASGASDVFTLVVNVGAATSGSLSNTATVSTTTADPNAANDSATAATTVAAPLSADLSVTKTDGPDPVTAGNPLTYTITVANAGPNAAVSAMLNDSLPAGVTFASLTSAAGWSCTTPAAGGTGLINCTKPSVLSGASDVFTLVVNVGAATSGSLSNTATVSTTTADPNAANDSATAVTTVAVAKTLVINFGNGATGLPNDVIPIEVTASDNGTPVAGVTINWALVSGSATLSSNTGTTDASGWSPIDVDLGPANGPRTVVVSATRADNPAATVNFTLNVSAVARNLAISSGNNQTGLVNAPLAAPLVAHATDNGADAPGITVNWAVTGGTGSGTLSAPNSVTDPTGLASVGLTFGATPGTVTVTGTRADNGAAVVTFTETSTLTRALMLTSGNNQTGPTSAPLPAQLVVTAQDNGANAAGITINWTVTGSASLSAPSTVTNGLGQASVGLTFGATPGTVTVTGTRADDATATVTFTETSTLSRTLTIVSGNNQTAGPGAPLPSPLVVNAKDNGIGVPGVTINWTITAGGAISSGPGNVTAAGSTHPVTAAGATLSASSSTTDAAGNASVTVTLNAIPGIVTISGARADDPTVTVSFTVATAALSNLPGITPEEHAIAVALDNACDALAALSSRTTEQQDLYQRCLDLVNATTLDPTDVLDALDELFPDLAFVQGDAGLNAAQAQFQNLKARIAALRSGTQGTSFGGLALTNGTGTISLGSLMEAFSDDKKPEVGSDFSRWGFFASGTIGRAKAKQGEVIPAYSYDINGITAGLDYRKSDKLIFGGAVGFTHQDTDLKDGEGSVKTTGWSVSGYSTYYRENSWYTDAVLTLGHNNYDTKRVIDYSIPLPGGGTSTINEAARSSSGGSLVEGAFTFGRDFQKGPLAIGPYGRLLYTRLNFDQINETTAPGPGSGLGVSIDSRDLTSFASQIGTKFSYAHSTDWGVLMPHAQIEWEHEFKGDPQAITAHFLNDPTSTPITITGDARDTDFFRLGVGMSVVMTHGRSGFFYVEDLLGRDGYSQYNLAFGVRIEF